MLATCFGHCGPSSGHKNVYTGKLYSVRSLVELRIWSVASFSKTVINHLQNLCVIKCVTVKADTDLTMYSFSSLYIFVTRG